MNNNINNINNNINNIKNNINNNINNNSNSSLILSPNSSTNTTPKAAALVMNTCHINPMHPSHKAYDIASSKAMSSNNINISLPFLRPSLTLREVGEDDINTNTYGNNSNIITNNYNFNNNNSNNFNNNNFNTNQRGNLNMTVVLGNPGTGKSLAADYFRQGAKKRNLRTVSVQALETDNTVRYGVLSKIFWGLADPNNEYEGDLQGKIDLADSVLRNISKSDEHSNAKARKFLMTMLELEFLGSVGFGGGIRGSASGEAHVTVLDRRMSKTIKSPKGV